MNKKYYNIYYFNQYEGVWRFYKMCFNKITTKLIIHKLNKCKINAKYRLVEVNKEQRNLFFFYYN